MSSSLSKELAETSSASSRLPMLDGMRGIAAFAVVLIHVNLIPGMNLNLPHAGLAVDFFFVLSGFVIARAYETKLKTSMGFLDFVRVRLLRLYPMLFAGVLIGCLPFLARLVVLHSLEFRTFIIMLGHALLVFPTTVLDPRSIMYPVDPPEWSLFFELAANFAFVVMVRRLNTPRLAVLCLVACVALCIVAWLNQGLAVGCRAPEFFFGFVRAGFSFFVGVLLHRFRPLGFTKEWVAAGLAVLLAVLFFNPFFEKKWLYDFITVALVFPAIVLLASRCENAPLLGAACRTAGELSYPLYMVHYPLLYIIGRTVEHVNGHIAPGILAIFGVALSLTVAVLLLRLWDPRARKWLGILFADKEKNDFVVSDISP